MSNLLRSLCVHTLSGFVILNQEYFAFLRISSVATFIGYVLLYAVTFYWISRILKKCFINYRVSPDNKAVLITGCDRGFGHLLAKKLHSEGYKVFAACLFPTGEGAKDLEKLGPRNIHIVGLDVTISESVSKALEYVLQHLGKSELWAVVNNAGIFNLLEVEFADEENYRRMFDVNSLGVVRVTKAFLPLLRKSRGRVVTMTSLAGRLSFPTTSSYCMSKFATTAFCECLRLEMRRWGVKVVTIEPEMFRSDMTATDAILSVAQDAWENAPEQTKLDYGEEYLKLLKSYLKYVLKFASPCLTNVTDSMFDAVSLKKPDYCYKPRHNFIRRLAAFLLEYQPRMITGFAFRIFLILVGRPILTRRKN